MKEDKAVQQLYTERGEHMDEVPWNVYPRPQMRRSKWMCLNGIWELEADHKKKEVLVPFCLESILSGYDQPVKYGEVLCYRRTFEIPEDWKGVQVLLHFGAVNSFCEVVVNGTKVGQHENGYLAFTMDITDALVNDSENDLEVIVQNDLSGRYPLGKQREKRGGMWYTPCSGIWQSVWLEPVPEKYIQGIQIAVDATGADITVEGISEGTLRCEEKEYPIVDGKVRVEPENVHLWSPEEPYLYKFRIYSGEDKIHSYFALRTIRVVETKGYAQLFLNDQPYFFHGVLDQGYFSDGLYTPADPGEYEKDILSMKSLGFNMLRKHIKIEPEQFYYDCDRLGMIVFQDMVNNSDYKMLRDTIMPTIGFKKVDDSKKHRDPKAREAFLDGMRGTVAQLSNHSCICYWTIFNEGWGQFEADRVYEILQGLDGSRIIDSTSGWFQQKQTDVESLHMYFEKLHLGKRTQLPQVLSEFGGYVYKIPKHSYHLKNTYGYKIFKDRESFVNAFREVYLQQVIPLAEKGLSASVYTQLSDVEDETNGLLTYDRKVCKLLPKDVSEIATALQKAVQKRCKEEL